MSKKFSVFIAALFGLSDLAFTTFLALKVTNVITWSWVLVTMPVWAMVIFIVLFIITTFLIIPISMLIFEAIKDMVD